MSVPHFEFACDKLTHSLRPTIFCDDFCIRVVYIAFDSIGESRTSYSSANEIKFKGIHTYADRSLHMKNKRAAQGGRFTREDANTKAWTHAKYVSAQARSTNMIAELEMDKANEQMETVFLDPDQKSPRAQDF